MVELCSLSDSLKGQYVVYTVDNPFKSVVVIVETMAGEEVVMQISSEHKVVVTCVVTGTLDVEELICLSEVIFFVFWVELGFAFALLDELVSSELEALFELSLIGQ